MNLYQESQQHIHLASECLHAGDISTARSHFCIAGELQWRYVSTLPDDRVKTLSIYGLSAATLYYRGHDIARAEQIAYSLLLRPQIEEHAAGELRELLSRIWNERQFEIIGLDVAEDPLSVIFRKGRVLYGVAPTDAVDTPIRSVLNLFQRIAAWKSHLPLTPKPSNIINEQYHAFSSQPVAGSYRIDLYLAREKQLSLDMPEIFTPTPTPDDIISSFLDVVRSASKDDYESLSETIPDEAYRCALTKLVRNVIPDGEQVGEVEFRRASDLKECSVLLTDRHRPVIRQMIKTMQQATSPQQTDTPAVQPHIYSGILRAVDLDNNKLRLDLPGIDKVFEFRKGDEILDDMIGPLLNKRVVITGSLKKIRARQVFFASDLELDTNEST